MKNLKQFGRRSLALVLVFIMCMSMLQLTAFAAEGNELANENSQIAQGVDASFTDADGIDDADGADDNTDADGAGDNTNADGAGDNTDADGADDNTDADGTDDNTNAGGADDNTNAGEIIEVYSEQDAMFSHPNPHPSATPNPTVTNATLMPTVTNADVIYYVSLGKNNWDETYSTVTDGETITIDSFGDRSYSYSYVVFFAKPQRDCLLTTAKNSYSEKTFDLYAIETVINSNNRIGGNEYPGVSKVAEKAAEAGYVAAFGYSRPAGQSLNVEDASFTVEGTPTTLGVSAVRADGGTEAVPVGETVSFNVTLTTTRNDKITDSDLQDLSVTINGHSVEVPDLEDLQATNDGTYTFTVDYKVAKGDGNSLKLEATADVEYTYDLAASGRAEGSPAITTSTTCKGTAEATVQISPTPRLTDITKEVDEGFVPTSVKVGETVTLPYTITVTGDKGAEYTVRDPGAELVSGSDWSGTIGETNKAEIHVTKTFTVTAEAIKDGKFTASNTAFVTADEKTDPIDPETPESSVVEEIEIAVENSPEPTRVYVYVRFERPQDAVDMGLTKNDSGWYTIGYVDVEGLDKAPDTNNNHAGPKDAQSAAEALIGNNEITYHSTFNEKFQKSFDLSKVDWSQVMREDGNKLYGLHCASGADGYAKEAPYKTPQWHLDGWVASQIAVEKTIADTNADGSPKTEYVAGDTITWKITVTNKGASPVYNLKLTDVLKDGNAEDSTRTVTVTDSKGNVVTEGYTFMVPAKDSENPGTATFTATMTNAEVGEYVNTVTVDDGKENPPTDEAQKVTVKPNIVVTKTIADKNDDGNEKTEYKVGETITWKITVENLGTRNESQLTLHDVLKLDGNTQELTVTDEFGRTIENFGLSAGDSQTFTVSLKTNAAGKYTNTVAVKDGDETKAEGEAPEVTVTQYYTLNVKAYDAEDATLLDTIVNGKEYEANASYEYDVPESIDTEATETEPAHHYVLDPVRNGEVKAGKVTGIMTKDIILDLIYSLDEKGGSDPDKEEGGPDGIPDKYQVKVTFQVENGSWNNDSKDAVSRYLNKYKVDEDGNYVVADNGDKIFDQYGEATVPEDLVPAVGEKPDAGYAQFGAWSVGNSMAKIRLITPANEKIDEDTTYIFAYTPVGQLTVVSNNYRGVYDGGYHTASVTVYDANGVDVTANATIRYNGNTAVGNTTSGYKDVGGNQTIPYTVSYPNYKDATGEVTVVITPRPLTITTSSASRYYNGEALTAPGVTVSGLVNGETVTAVATGSQTAVGSSKNTVALTWDGTAEEGNYTVTYVLGTLTVDPYTPPYIPGDDGDDDDDYTPTTPTTPTTPETPVTPNTPSEPDVVDVPDVDVPLVETPEVIVPDEDVPLAEIPEVVVPDEDVPLAEIPEVVVPDEDVPLAEIPEVVIPDEDVPLAELPEVVVPDEDVPLVELPPVMDIEIPDESVPLADVPKTGDNAQVWAILALTSGLGLAWLALDSKKREENA